MEKARLKEQRSFPSSSRDFLNLPIVKMKWKKCGLKSNDLFHHHRAISQICQLSK